MISYRPPRWWPRRKSASLGGGAISLSQQGERLGMPLQNPENVVGYPSGGEVQNVRIEAVVVACAFLERTRRRLLTILDPREVRRVHAKPLGGVAKTLFPFSSLL